MVIKVLNPSIELRKFSLNDVGSYFSLLEKNREHLSKYGTMTEGSYKTLDEVMQSIQNPPNPNKLRFGVWSKERMVGLMSLIPKDNQICEVGGWIGKDFTRKGYASSSLATLAKHALKNMNFYKVIATTNPENVASISMLKSAGFVFHEQVNNRNYFYFNG